MFNFIFLITFYIALKYIKQKRINPTEETFLCTASLSVSSMLNPCFVQELETPQWRSTDGGHFLRFLCLLSNTLFLFLWKPHILRHFLSSTFYSLGPPWSLECNPGPLYQLDMKFIFLVQVSPAPDSLWMEEAGVICIKA